MGFYKRPQVEIFHFLLSFSESLTWLQKGVAAEGGGEGGDKGQRDQTRQLIEASRNLTHLLQIDIFAKIKNFRFCS